ncbi:MAG: DUF1998 domain-containing protein, partial [Desulfatitalea sp.]|nr:DUF1998 domain-containing protein [Desulfatitalea sp.]NNK01678.1 DUF1998 domain-containing protein [Desulfatitalea sp.]
VVVLDIQQQTHIRQVELFMGRLRITDSVHAYDRIHTMTGRRMDQIPLQAPPTVFETQGIWFTLADDLQRRVAAQGFDFLGALHAAEHAAISMMPLLVLVDRNDLGGLSTVLHPQTGQATLFIYDGVPGGAGFCEQAFAQADVMLTRTREAVRACPCTNGCPACVHSPKCGSGNDPIDKGGAAMLLELLCRHQPAVSAPGQAAIAPAADLPMTHSNRWATEKYVVFDLETQRSAQEVGGWHRADRMRISCGVVYDAERDHFSVYTEDRVAALIDHLKRAELVVGFNCRRFDYKVLSGYTPFDLSQLPTLDLLQQVHQRLGFRLSLDHLASKTLGAQKTADGLDALRWWRQGKMDKIVDYCRADVRITRDLFHFLRRTGYLLYQARDGQRYRVKII